MSVNFSRTQVGDFSLNLKTNKKLITIESIRILTVALNLLGY